MEDIMLNEDESIKLPQPEDLSSHDKDSAFGVYYLMFASQYIPLPFIEILFSAIFYHYYKKRSRFVAFHSYQSMVAQVPISIINTILTIWAVVTFIFMVNDINYSEQTTHIYLISLASAAIVVGIINLIYLIISIVASVYAKRGNFFYMPIVGKFSFARFYGPYAKTFNVINKARTNTAP